MQTSLPAVQLWPPHGKFLIVYFFDMQRIMYMGICNNMANLEYATYWKQTWHLLQHSANWFATDTKILALLHVGHGSSFT